MAHVSSLNTLASILELLSRTGFIKNQLYLYEVPGKDRFNSWSFTRRGWIDTSHTWCPQSVGPLSKLGAASIQDDGHLGYGDVGLQRVGIIFMFYIGSWLYIMLANVYQLDKFSGHFPDFHTLPEILNPIACILYFKSSEDYCEYYLRNSDIKTEWSYGLYRGGLHRGAPFMPCGRN